MTAPRSPAAPTPTPTPTPGPTPAEGGRGPREGRPGREGPGPGRAAGRAGIRRPPSHPGDLPGDLAADAAPVLALLDVHAAVLRELRAVPALVRAAAPSAVAGRAALVEHVHLVLDLLRARPRPGGAPDGLAELADRCARHTDAWAGGPTGSAARRLVEAVGGLADAAGPTLALEREQLRAAMAPLAARDRAAWALSGLARLEPARLLVGLGLLLEDVTPRRRADLLRALPVGARLRWRASGRAACARHSRRLGGA